MKRVTLTLSIAIEDGDRLSPTPAGFMWATEGMTDDSLAERARAIVRALEIMAHQIDAPNSLDVASRALIPKA